MSTRTYTARGRRPKPLILGRSDRRQPTAKRQGLTRLEVDALVQSQGGVCALCQLPLPSNFVVDHDHKKAAVEGHDPTRGCPGCVRGAVCQRCNQVLAGAWDEPEIFLRAARYVVRRRVA